MWRKTNEEGEKFEWSQVKWLRYTKEFGIIYYKTTLNENEPFKKLNINKRGICSVQLNELQLCYVEQIKISDAKKKDLMDLLQFIEPSFHTFYQELKCDSDILNIHPDLVDVESEEE